MKNSKDSWECPVCGTHSDEKYCGNCGHENKYFGSNKPAWLKAWLTPTPTLEIYAYNRKLFDELPLKVAAFVYLPLVVQVGLLVSVPVIAFPLESFATVPIPSSNFHQPMGPPWL